MSIAKRLSPQLLIVFIVLLLQSSFLLCRSDSILSVTFGSNVSPTIQKGVQQWIDTLPQERFTGKYVTVLLGNAARQFISPSELSSLGNDDAYILRVNTTLTTLFICADGNLPNGVSYGAYAVLQEVFGFGFLHPFKVHLSPLIEMARRSEVNLEDVLRKNGRLDLVTSVHLPFLSRRGIHIHTEHPLELTNFLNGFASKGGLNYQDRNEWKKGMIEWQQFCEWMIANKQTSVEWVLLFANEWQDFADSIERQDRLTEIVKLSHSWGIEVGLDVPIAMEQQHAWRLIRKYGNVKEEIQDLHQHIDYVMKAGFDFIATELGFSEFTHGDPNKMVLWLNESAIYLDEKYGKTVYAKVHVSKGQTVNSYIDPLTHKPGCNFNFLSYYADSRLGVMPHTVQMFSMDDPAYTYGNVNFTDIRDFMYLELGKRKVIFHPETAYWVTFDINVPLFLPVYAHRRYADIRNIAKHTARVGIPIDGQMVFSSGWEYGYWLSDALTARMTWNPHLEIEDETRGLLVVIDEITKTFIFDMNARSNFNQILMNQMQDQKAYLVDGMVGGKPPSSQLLRSGISYLAGWDTWSDLNEFVETVANVQTLTQPNKISFFEVISKSDNGLYENSVRPLIFEMTNQFNLTHVKYMNFMNQYSSVLFSGEMDLLNEILDCTLLVALRSKLILRLYEYALLKSKILPYEPETPAMIYQKRDALDTINLAQTVIEQRMKNFRLDPSRSTSWGVNPTAYSYGYLWHTKKLFFWWRDYAKAILGYLNPCFMNEDNPADIAFGDGIPQTIAQLLQDFLEKVRYLDWIEPCFAVNVTKEPNVPPFSP